MNKKNYICLYCKYSTDIHCNYQKHCNTIKHKKNIYSITEPQQNHSRTTIDQYSIKRHNGVHKDENNSKNICKYCNSKFTRQDALTRHIKKCTELKYQEEIKRLKEKIKEQKILLDHKNDIIEYTKTTNNKVTEVLNDSLKDLRQTVKYERKFSKHQFLQHYLSNPPDLKQIEDYTILHKEYKTLTAFCNDLIYYYGKGKLHSYLGNFLVSQYSKDNIKEQSLFSSDTSRHNFICSLNNIKKKKNEWINDKNGIYVSDTIIDPLLKYVYDIILEYSQDIVKIVKAGVKNGSKSLNLAESMLFCEQIMMTIDDKSLKDDIKKHISPYFDLIKEKILQNIVDNSNLLNN